MVNITLSIPEDLHKKMKKHSEIRWSEVVRRAIKERMDDLELMDCIAGRSVLREDQAEFLAGKVKARAAAKFLKK
jgi:hypothetical protein